MTEPQKISWIGCGKVGMTLAGALRNAGFQPASVICRTQDHAQKAVDFIGAGTASTEISAALSGARVHFITTNDDSVKEVVNKIRESAKGSLQDHYFFHTSGALSSNVLEPLRGLTAETGSVHPLQVFADPSKAMETLPGVYYAIEGTDKAMQLAVQLVDRLQGKLLLIPTGRKVFYHIAGVFAANYLTVLADLALSIMEDLGETPEDAYQAFLPLMVSALQNIEEFGVGAALTGPISRGDAVTIQQHLEALDELRPEVRQAYEILGREAVNIALRAGRITDKKAREISAILKPPTIH